MEKRVLSSNQHHHNQEQPRQLNQDTRAKNNNTADTYFLTPTSSSPSCPGSISNITSAVEAGYLPIASTSTSTAAIATNTIPSTVYNRSSSNKNEPSAQSVRFSQARAISSPQQTSDIDTNNNDDDNNRGSASSSNTRNDGSNSVYRRPNLSKAASEHKLINRANRPNVCDCLAQNCREKEHSNRRQFIERYYNSKTQLPSAKNTTLAFNVNTPLNRLGECDAITKRLLSSPIRATVISESPTKCAQATEVEKSRRASLGTNTMTDQVFLFSSNQFNSLEMSCHKRCQNDDQGDDDDTEDNQQICDLRTSGNKPTTGKIDAKLKQQQGRSLSVCDKDTLKPQLRNTSSSHSSNLNRAVSLACESGLSSKQLLTIIPLFGCDIKALEQFLKLSSILPPSIDSAVDHLLVNGVNAIGIFRKSGVKSRILTLRQQIEANQYVKIDDLNKDNDFSIYDIADLVKMWFRELKPVPLMTKELIIIVTQFLHDNQQLKFTERAHSSSHQDTTETFGCNNSQVSLKGRLDQNLKSKIFSTISPTHRALFSRALSFLASISSKSETNQMTSQNLAICLTPSLCATESDQNSIIMAQRALEFCINNYRMLI